MKVLSAEFVTSAAAGGDAAGIPRDGIPQIAFAGRSNVGKSSLLNALCRRKVARTSAAPGKTRLANIYRVVIDGVPRPGSGQAGTGTRNVYLVDLPGYGYARGGEDAARQLQAVAEAYFRGAQRGAALLLIDSRHPGLQSDVSAYEWLAAAGAEPHLVATKIDKLSRSERARHLKAIGDMFGAAALPVSAQSGEGLNELWQLIIRLARNR